MKQFQFPSPIRLASRQSVRQLAIIDMTNVQYYMQSIVARDTCCVPFDFYLTLQILRFIDSAYMHINGPKLKFISRKQMKGQQRKKQKRQIETKNVQMISQSSRSWRKRINNSLKISKAFKILKKNNFIKVAFCFGKNNRQTLKIGDRKISLPFIVLFVICSIISFIYLVFLISRCMSPVALTVCTLYNIHCHAHFVCFFF